MLSKTFILQEHWAFDQLDSMEILKESLTKSSLLMELGNWKSHFAQISRSNTTTNVFVQHKQSSIKNTEIQMN